MTDLLFVWSPLIVAVAALSFATYIIWLGFNGFVDSERLRRRGRKVAGQVLSKSKESIYVRPEERHRTRQRYHHVVAYEIEVQGNQFTGKSLMSETDWNGVEAGDTLDVLYLPKDPSVNQLASVSINIGLAGGSIQMVVGALIASAAAGYLIYGAATALFPSIAEVSPGPDWVEDTGEVLAILPSDDPFVRLLRPANQTVLIAVGDSDGGRNVVGRARVLMTPEDLQALSLGQSLPVLRHPLDLDQAVVAQ